MHRCGVRRWSKDTSENVDEIPLGFNVSEPLAGFEPGTYAFLTPRSGY